MAKRKIDGVLLLDKPFGISSNNALQKARWLLQAEKGGHTGVLDPFATGLLPLCFGEATKFAQRMLKPIRVIAPPLSWVRFQPRSMARVKSPKVVMRRKMKPLFALR